mmetsp:Transcript_2538/g.5833  ORF Transcript_2538/g.5833 Transcript_2538/m.5833 type:complete len:200 (+) Transcript_2538:842-1441(+)
MVATTTTMRTMRAMRCCIRSSMPTFGMWSGASMRPDLPTMMAMVTPMVISSNSHCIFPPKSSETQSKDRATRPLPLLPPPVDATVPEAQCTTSRPPSPLIKPARWRHCLQTFKSSSKPRNVSTSAGMPRLDIPTDRAAPSRRVPLAIRAAGCSRLFVAMDAIPMDRPILFRFLILVETDLVRMGMGMGMVVISIIIIPS